MKSIFVKTAFVVIALFCVYTTIKLQFDLNKLVDDREALEAQIEAQELRLEKLQEEYERPFDRDYVIKVAREKLNYRLPEEIIFYNDLAK